MINNLHSSNNFKSLLGQAGRLHELAECAHLAESGHVSSVPYHICD